MQYLWSDTWSFLKQQSHFLGTWIFLSLCSNLAALGCVLTLIVLGASLVVLLGYMINAAVMTVKLFCVISVCFVLFLFWFLLRKIVILFNVILVNTLDAAHGRSLRGFSHRVDNMKTMMVGICYAMLVTLGSLFLIIPGILCLIYFNLAYWIMLEDDCSITQSFIRSSALVSHNFWKVSVFMGLLFLLQCIPFFWILNIFFPAYWLCLSFLYVRLKESHLTRTQSLH